MAKERLIDVDELPTIEDQINGAEIQGRITLDNLFTLNETLRYAKEGIDNANNEIKKANSDIYNAGFIMTQRGLQPSDYLRAERVKEQAEINKREAEQRKAELEGIIPDVIDQIEQQQNEFEDILE